MAFDPILDLFSHLWRHLYSLASRTHVGNVKITHEESVGRGDSVCGGLHIFNLSLDIVSTEIVVAATFVADAVLGGVHSRVAIVISVVSTTK